MSDETIMKMPTYHVIILAKNDTGTREFVPPRVMVASEVFLEKTEDPEECAE